MVDSASEKFEKRRVLYHVDISESLLVLM